MMIEITLLQQNDEKEYEAVLKTNESALLYSSIEYRNLLRQVVGGEDYYLVAKQNGQIVGMFPTFIKYNSKCGNVLNSLPFYGSNGGAICGSFLSDARSVKRQLLDVFQDLAREKEVVASTIITSPFEEDIDIYGEFTRHDYQDSRIGQISILPAAMNGDLDTALMEMLHYKTRNMIRKAHKANIQHRHSANVDDLRFLAELHRQNIEAIGGLAKDWNFFRLIPEIFAYDTDYRVYIAELDGKRIAALLIFYYHQTVEYFTPAVVVKYRNLQPSSLLIFEAMKDAAQRGFQYWNWGGTWHSQKGVYNFKKRWGTEDKPYFYYTKIFDKQILNSTKEQLLREYPYFYVVPFENLSK